MLSLLEFRKEKDRFLEWDEHSPIPHEQRHEFKGLKYYPEDLGLRFEVEVVPFQEQELVQMQTSTGEFDQYIRYGRFQFDVDGETAELTLFTSEQGDTFLPFVDATSPRETYGAGRYLELEKLGENRFMVDFNLAYNPWCAYSPSYSCPLPPDENRLTVPIRAGEMNYS